MDFQQVKDLLMKGVLTAAPLELLHQDGIGGTDYLNLRPPKDMIYIPIVVWMSHSEAATKVLYWRWYAFGTTKVMGSESLAVSVRTYLYKLIGTSTPLVCTRDSYLDTQPGITAGQYYGLTALLYKVDGVEKAREDY